ncbi:MAG: OB-fold putative lipoprotein [Deltaproteobacteria bacterium]|nr:OB-fold putative lipoprotein [Deltaproteobacteria bacterium]
MKAYFEYKGKKIRLEGDVERIGRKNPSVIFVLLKTRKKVFGIDQPIALNFSVAHESYFKQLYDIENETIQAVCVCSGMENGAIQLNDCVPKIDCGRQGSVGELSFSRIGGSHKPGSGPAAVGTLLSGFPMPAESSGDRGRSEAPTGASCPVMRV